MWRQRISRALLCLTFAGAPCASLRADDVAAFLDRHGLRQLLALHLREKMETAPPQERETLAVRLAELYAELLETTEDVSERVDLEKRSQDLLALVPDDSADGLRLALLRGGYIAAERVAEAHRLRQSDEASVARAIEILTDALPRFADLRGHLGDRLEVVDRRVHRAIGAEAASLSQEAEKLRLLHTRCLFLSAWAQYYLGWLEGRTEHARNAEALFAEIIDPEAKRAHLEDVSLDLLSTEAAARTILGIALCKSLQKDVEASLRWLDLLDGEDVFPALREAVDAWRIAVLLENSDFGRARNALEAARAASREMPLVWVRLVAALSLERAPNDPEAAALARQAIADLAARGELQQVLDLAGRYGVESIGDSGFAVLYVRGAQRYQQARDLHGDDQPTARTDVAGAYDEAASLFLDAQRQADAPMFPVAAAGAQSLIGWCYYFQGRFLDARLSFEAASNTLPATEAPEAMWMAIVSLDRVVRAGSSTGLESELRSLIDRFRERFPSSEYIPRLVLRGAEAASRQPTMEAVDELLAIPSGSADYETAQRLAEQMLFTMFQNAAGARKTEIGDRYVNLAVALLSRVTDDSIRADDAAGEVFLTRCRRVLDVALSPGVDRERAAQDVLGRLDELAATGILALDAHGDEIDFRRVRLHLQSGVMVEAEAVADRLWQRDSRSRWSVAAIRAIFKRAAEEWRASGAPGPALLSRVLKYGGRSLQEYEAVNASMGDPAVLAAYSTVAEAGAQAWRTDSAMDAGRAAFLIYEQLLDARPNNAVFLRALAILAPSFGTHEQALDCWRRLVAGTQQGTDAWFEAKHEMMGLLIDSDRARAREVMDQHKALYPDLGPEPWKSRFMELDDRIGVASDGGGESGGGVDVDGAGS